MPGFEFEGSRIRNVSKKPQGKGHKRGKAKGTWPVTYKWVAMGTMVAYTALGGEKIAVAQAQSTRPQAAAPVHHFEVPAGQLKDILPTFERASELHVVLANSAIGGVQSPGVSGDYTNDQAFAQLLGGTRLSYRLTSPGVATLDLSSIEQSITVNAHYGEDPYADPDAPYKADRLASTKFTEPVLNTPRTETILTQEALEDKNATALRDVLRSTAGITLGSGEGGNAFGDRFFHPRL